MLIVVIYNFSNSVGQNKFASIYSIAYVDIVAKHGIVTPLVRIIQTVRILFYPAYINDNSQHINIIIPQDVQPKFDAFFVFSKACFLYSNFV